VTGTIFSKSVELNKYPKVLVFGEGFRDVSGPGLTLTSLFKGWPSDKIADVHASIQRNDEVTTNHIYLPMRGITSVWRKEKGKRNSRECNVVGETVIAESSTKRILRTLLSDTLYWYRDGASKTIREIKAFNPDILYVQPSFGNSIAILKLHDLLKKIPMVSHVMDDWPGQWTYSPSKIERLLTLPEINAFKKILNRSKKRMTICKAMSKEYTERYKGDFTSFQRLIDVDDLPIQSENNQKKQVKLFYIGRVGVAVKENLKLVAQAVEDLVIKNINVDFIIVTAQKQEAKKLGLEKYLDEKAPYPSKDIPEVIKKADILLLPLDFSSESLRFSRLSMPSKVPEYLSSGKPCLVLAPKSTAVAQYASDYKWGKVVTENTIDAVVKAIENLLASNEERLNLVDASIETYIANHSSQQQRNLFQTVLTEVKKNV